jgi:hypothetical protein
MPHHISLRRISMSSGKVKKCKPYQALNRVAEEYLSFAFKGAKKSILKIFVWKVLK